MFLVSALSVRFKRAKNCPIVRREREIGMLRLASVSAVRPEGGNLANPIVPSERPRAEGGIRTLKLASILLVLFGNTILCEDLFYPVASDNFVIRWAFQELCNHSFDPRKIWPTPGKTTFNPASVKAGEMIFVRDAPYFFKHLHPKIKVPYFILTHGEYLDTFQDSYFKYVREKNVLGWFTIHPPERRHEKVFPIPLGIIQYNDLYEKRGEAHRHFLKYRKAKRDKLLYMNFTDWRNPERKRIRDLFLTKHFCDNGFPCRFTQYSKETAQHKFIVSPPGLGPDCYRVYESLLVGTIPIVQHSYLDYMYEGLPVLFINEWEEVTEEFLEAKYKEMTSRKYNPEKLYMEYWVSYIAHIRNRIMREHNIVRPV